MKIPLIKHITEFVETHDADFIQETIAVLEHISELESLKEEELDVIGELISNLYGALEVQKSMEDGLSKKDAMNGFMQRVLGSIDT
jgi:hypothetical protein